MSAGQVFRIARGYATDLGKIALAEPVTPAQLGAMLKTAQAQPVSFAFEQISQLNAAKQAGDKNAARKLAALKQTAWFCCATFTTGKRQTQFVDKVNAIVVDADKPGAEHMPAALDAMGCSYLLCTSTSHGCGGQPRYRGIVPLAEPIEPGRYSAVWQHFNERLPGLDPAAKDPTRLNYMPRIPNGAEGHKVIVVDDLPWFDASVIVENEAAAPTVAGTVAGNSSHQLLTTIDDDALADLREAMRFAPLRESAADNGVWSEAAYALLSLGARGRELFVEWSKDVPNYAPGAPEAWWASHETQTPRTDFRHLFTMARGLGWRAPKPADPSAFDIVDPDEGLPTKPKRPPLPFASLPEDVLTRAFPEREFAIPQYLPRGTTSLLLSVGGYGKTYLLLLMAVSKAAGLQDFFGPCTPGRVVILTAEDDMSEMLRRVQRILRQLTKRGVQVDQTLLHRNLQIVDLTGSAAANQLVKTDHSGATQTTLADHIAKEIGQADFIAIDTLSRFAGSVSENDNSAAAVFISACEAVAKETGAAVLVLAHTGKAVMREGLVDQYIGRGASAFSDNARSVMALASPSKEGTTQYEISDDEISRGDKFRLAHVKANYCRKADDLYLERGEDGVVLPYQPALKIKSTPDELVLRLLGWIGKGETRRNDVGSKFKEIFDDTITKVRAFEVFDAAKRSGQLKFKKNRNNADYFIVDDSVRVVVDAPNGSDGAFEELR